MVRAEKRLRQLESRLPRQIARGASRESERALREFGCTVTVRDGNVCRVYADGRVEIIRSTLPGRRVKPGTRFVLKREP